MNTCKVREKKVNISGSFTFSIAEKWLENFTVPYMCIRTR